MVVSHGHAIFTRSYWKRTPKGCAVPLVACKGLMDREAPKLGAGVGRQARKRAGFGGGTASLQVARCGCSRSIGLQVLAGDGRCRADGLQGIGLQGMAAVCFSAPKFSGSLLLYARLVFPLPAYPKIYQVKSFQVARNFPPCAARVFLPIFCARG